MSFNDCINNAEGEGAIDKKRAQEIRKRYKTYAEQLVADYGADAEAEAARRAFREMEYEAARRRRLKVLQAQKTGALSKLQGAFINYRGERDPAEFLVNIIKDVGGKAGTSTVEGRYQAVLGRAHGRMTEAIGKFERDLGGRTRNKPLLKDMVRALFGEKTGAEAKMLANSWNDAAEFLRQRFNAAGGDIGKLDKWGLPQNHDSVAIARAGYKAWRDDITPRLDLAKMIDRETGAPFTAEKLELALKEAYDAITTDGWSRVKPSGAAGGKALANRRQEHRFFAFKSADDWLDYQERFGSGDAFATMMHHLDGMARDIGAMEVLGPNPLSTIRYLEQSARKWAAEMDAKEPGRKFTRSDDANVKAFTANNMWALFNGSANKPVNGFVARAIVNTRSILTSAQLGSAALSSITDAKTQALARKFNGLEGSKTIGDIARLMSPGNAADRRLAVRAGLIAEGAAQAGLAQARYMGELHAGKIARWFADTTLRISGLSPWTQGGRWAFGMEFMGALADRSGKSIDVLRAGDDADKAFARALDRYQLAGAWDEIRKTPAYEPEKGATFLRPEDVAERLDLGPERADLLANRLLEMIRSETEFAVPTADLRARAVTEGGARKGTIPGELVNSFTMYKSFPTTIAYLTASRTMEQGAAGAAMGGAGYAASVIFGMTMYGALAVQMKNIAAGRDPQSMNPFDDDGLAFWGAALLQGGGLGIFGDFLFASESRAGGGLAATIGGPVVGLASDVQGLTIGNLQQAAAGDDPRVGRDAVRFLRSYTPFGNLWYLRAGYQRAVLDNLQRMVDPEAEQYFRRRTRDRARDYGNEYFWAPGETLPARAPDPAAILGAPDR